MDYRIRKFVDLINMSAEDKKALSDAYAEVAAAAIARSKTDPNLLDGWNKLYADG